MADVQALYEKTMKLPTSDKLRLAAELLDSGRLDLAESVAQRAVEEMAFGNVTRKVR